ncbi:MAG: hypothetical protein WA005_01825, partial [Candidatus Binataceae bacterium]
MKPRARLRRFDRDSLLLAGVIALVLVAFLRSLSNGFVYDDRGAIVENHLIGEWSFLWKSMVHRSYWFLDPLHVLHLGILARYHPLLSVWFGLNYQLFGLWTPGWHAAAVAGHLMVVWLVYKVGCALTGERRAALLAALLFGVLPVHAEAVAFVAGFAVVMSAGFELGALYLVMKRADKGWGNLTAALVLYAAALLSHESAASFPALVAAYVFLLEPPPAENSGVLQRLRAALAVMAPFAVEVLAYLAVRRLILGFLATDPLNPANEASLEQVLMTMPWVITAYLGLLLAPWWAGPAHRVMFVTSPWSPQFYLSVAVLAGVGLAFWLVVRRHPRRLFYLFCAAWMGVAIAPVVLSLGALLNDHLVHDVYLYMASAGWCIL